MYVYRTGAWIQVRDKDVYQRCNRSREKIKRYRDVRVSTDTVLHFAAYRLSHISSALQSNELSDISWTQPNIDPSIMSVYHRVLHGQSGSPRHVATSNTFLDNLPRFCDPEIQIPNRSQCRIVDTFKIKWDYDRFFAVFTVARFFLLSIFLLFLENPTISL